jgi:hypothetical protein
MTDKQIAQASKDAEPKEGEVLVYIDWQGNKLYAKPEHKPKSTTTKDNS